MILTVILFPMLLLTFWWFFFYANIVYDNIVTSYSMLLFCSEPAGSCCKELALLPNKNIWVKLITWSRSWIVTWALLISKLWFVMLCPVSFEPFVVFLQCSRYFHLEDVLFDRTLLAHIGLQLCFFRLFYQRDFMRAFWLQWLHEPLLSCAVEEQSKWVFVWNAALDVKTKLDSRFIWIAAKWSRVCHGEPQGAINVPLN